MFTSFSAWALDFLSKAAGHKYIRRIPYTSGGKLRYRYIYKVTHTAGGKHALHEDDVTVGAAFMLGTDKGSEVHAHVKSVDGDKVTVEYDDGPRKGEKETMSKRDLLSKLDAAHGISAALQSEREKQAKVVAELRASGASEKQIAREQARLDRLGVEAKKPEAKRRGSKKGTVDEPIDTRPLATRLSSAMTNSIAQDVYSLQRPEESLRADKELLDLLDEAYTKLQGIFEPLPRDARAYTSEQNAFSKLKGHTRLLRETQKLTRNSYVSTMYKLYEERKYARLALQNDLKNLASVLESV